MHKYTDTQVSAVLYIDAVNIVIHNDGSSCIVRAFVYGTVYTPDKLALLHSIAHLSAK
jgi:hypothetical protein